jgi:hypothetical protein
MNKFNNDKRISAKNFIFMYLDAESIPLDLAYRQLRNTLKNHQINEYLLCKNGKTLCCWFALDKTLQIYSRNKFCIYNTKLEKLLPDLMESPTKIDGLNKAMTQLPNLADTNSYLTNIPL